MNGTSAPSSVEIEGLEVGVGSGAGGRTLVRGLSLHVRSAEVWCVLGANGAGKSTLLHTLIGLHRATAGTIRLAGRPLDAWPVEAAARVRGFLPQFIHDTFGASVLDIVLMGRHPHVSRWHWEGDADRDAARAALAALGLAPLAERDITTLSGGERQRVAIAALLAQDPGILLLDEPINHLDLHHQIVVLQHLSELARVRDKAVLFSIHDLNLARRFATHALILQDGGLARHGPAAEVMNAPVLSAAFGYPVQEARVGARTVFIAE